MTGMTHTPAAPGPQTGSSRAVRDVADAYVRQLAEHDPTVGTDIGLPIRQDELPDLTPAWHEAGDELARATLTRLAAIEQEAGPAGFIADDERRCARLLRERLETQLSVSAAGEHLRAVSNIFGPPQEVRGTFLMMPAATTDDWAVIARRLGQVPAALAGYQACLAEGASRGLFAAPRQADTVAAQLDEWQQTGDGLGWFSGFASGVPAEAPSTLRSDLAAAAADADAAVAGLRDWLRADYLPRAAGTPDGVGEDRYRTGVKRWNGATIDVGEAYEWGWSQYREIVSEMQAEAEKILPGSTPSGASRKSGSGCSGSWTTQSRTWTGRTSTWPSRSRSWRPGSRRRAAPPRRTTRCRRRTSRGRAGPGCPPSGRPDSRCGSSTAPGTTRVSPVITCSSLSGSTSRGSCRSTRRRLALSAPAPRAGRCTRSG